MNELEKELEKMKNRLGKIKEGVKKEDYFQYTNNLFVANSIFKLINIFNTRLFGTEEENKILSEEVEKDSKRAELALINIEKGLVEWFDENSKPVSEELGCPYCGEYCYSHYDSHCEAEFCDFTSNTTVFCPKIKCRYEYHCQSTLTPLGLLLDENAKCGYKKEDFLSIFYKGKTYNFKVIAEYLTTGFLTELIRKFFDYDLTRKEMNEYIILESVNER